MQAAIKQTIMEAPPDTEQALHRLIDACHQCYQTHTMAAQTAPGAVLTIFFNQLATERQYAIANLQHILLRHDEHPFTDGLNPDTFESHPCNGMNDVHQFNTQLYHQELLEMCERQERHMLQQYEHVLQMHLPAEVIELISQQHRATTATLLKLCNYKPLDWNNTQTTPFHSAS